MFAYTRKIKYLIVPLVLVFCLCQQNTAEAAAKRIATEKLPPFFKKLVEYVHEGKSPWCTPGHQGGVGFLKSASGKAFYEFFGENIFKADVSSGMSELGSILEHTGPPAEAEAEAARIFGSDYTFFVTNGTSTSNKIVFTSCISPGDVVLADRNCHKSTMHAMIMTETVPVYLIPSRNYYGLIGPVQMNEFKPETLKEKLDSCPLLSEQQKEAGIRLSVLTNTTYDGMCYNIPEIKKLLAPSVDNMHFDEAWYAYANFHPLYEGRYGMSPVGRPAEMPPVFATQSTHKLLSAFSMASMIHIKNGTKTVVDPEIFKEAWLMHTSTSPFYPIVASLDVAARSMEGESGRRIMDDIIKEAIRFRKAMAKIYRRATAPGAGKKGAWHFRPWQPDGLEDISDEKLMSDPGYWILKKGDKWHGFDNIDGDKAMLDPIKVTILTPGINEDGSMAEKGIPAMIVQKYLYDIGIIPERTGFYSLLFLFSPGVTPEKTDMLLAKLEEFKRMYDKNAPLDKVFPDFVEENPNVYADTGLMDFCGQVHGYLRKKNIITLMKDIYLILPEQVMLPAGAYAQMVKGNVEYVPLRRLQGRIPAVMLAPYPPGIPVIMPGEKFTEKTSGMIDYFLALEELDNMFPELESEIHGITIEKENGKIVYKVICVKEDL